MSRRILLRGLGGACIAAPLLSSLADRGAKAAPVAPSKRLIAMFTHYGCITTRFFPTKSHGALSAADLNSTTLAPLAPYVDKLLIPRGIRAMNEWNATLIRGQGNDPHLQASGSYFTCQPLNPNSDDPFSFDTATRFNAMPMGASLDHVLAEQLSPSGLPLYMRVGNKADIPGTGISYSAAGVPYAGVGTPSEAFSKLTGLFKTDTPVNPDSYAAVRGKSIIDIVRGDLGTLERLDMSRADKLKLEAWKALLDDTGKVLSSAQCSQAVATKLGSTPENAALASAGTGDLLTAKVSASLDGADVYSAVAVLSSLCNESPVVFLNYPGQYVFTGLGLSVESHALSQRLANANMNGVCLPNAIEMISTIDRYYAQKFAKLVAMLNDVPESNGTTALDNSAAIWFQEMSDGNAHNLNNLPVIQAGSVAGYFKTGWAVNVDDGSANLSIGNSESVCGSATPPPTDGVSQSTGTDPALANAPINKYFCNLMNALGVKGGADGFPAKNGTREVSKFGRYDKTEDFVHGGTVPAAINDPREFDALKARV